MVLMPSAGRMTAGVSAASRWQRGRRRTNRRAGSQAVGPLLIQATMTGSARIEDLRAEARYARERYDLYRAKMYGLRPTTISRLRELERIHEGASARLRRAHQKQPPQSRT